MDVLKKPLKYYGFRLKDTDLLMESQSGGAFFAIAKFFIDQGAVVYGCGMDESMHAVYMRVADPNELVKIKGSKYVQADIREAYLQIQQELDLGKKVLFSGTPCYVNAVNKFFRKHPNLENLFTVDLICHGVPSPKIFHAYLQSLEDRHHSKIVEFVFRDKTKAGWHRTLEKSRYENGDIAYTEGYSQLYYTNLPIRPSCGSCPFSTTARCGDFTVGDYWGVEQHFPDFHDNRGVSLVFLNTKRAVGLFDEILSGNEWVESDESKSVLQDNLKSHTIIPKYRDQFWSDFNKKGIDYCVNRWSPIGIPFRIRRKIHYLLKKFFHIPHDTLWGK